MKHPLLSDAEMEKLRTTPGEIREVHDPLANQNHVSTFCNIARIEAGGSVVKLIFGEQFADGTATCRTVVAMPVEKFAMLANAVNHVLQQLRLQRPVEKG